MNPEERKHAAEQWLEEALGSRAELAQPRAGLETRILAHLQLRERQQRRNWIFVFAATAAALLLAVVLTRAPNSRQGTPAIAKTETTETRTSATQTGASRDTTAAVQKSGNQIAQGLHVSLQNAQTQKKRASANAIPTAATPQETARFSNTKQERFFSDQPLSEQARLLQIYLRQTPKQELQLEAARQQSAAEISVPDLNISSIEIEPLNPQSQTPTPAQTQNEGAN